MNLKDRIEKNRHKFKVDDEIISHPTPREVIIKRVKYFEELLKDVVVERPKKKKKSKGSGEDSKKNG